MGSNAAIVGNANPDNGLNVNDFKPDNGNDNVHAVRLIVSFRRSFLSGILLGGSDPSSKHFAYFRKFCFKL